MNILKKSILYLKGMSIMNRDEYLRELEHLLSDIDEQDRIEAIEYYKSYFDDAGVENEQKVIETLGTPYQLSQTIRDSLQGRFEENIEIGDDGIRSDKYQEKNEIQSKERKRRERMDKRDKMIFLVLLVLFCLPLSAILHTFSGIFGIVFSIFVFFFGFWIVTFIFYICAALFIVYGVSLIVPFIGSSIISVGGGLICLGTGFILIALGYIFGKIAQWFFKTFLPMLFRKIADGMNSLLNRRLANENDA